MNLVPLVKSFIEAGFSPNKITVVDIDSRLDKDLLSVYEKLQICGVKLVYHSSNKHGPWCLWIDNNLSTLLPFQPFIVTDSDIDISSLKLYHGTLRALKVLRLFPLADKVAWPLQLDDIDVEFKDSVVKHEVWKNKRLDWISWPWKKIGSLFPDELFSTCDTTLALYRRKDIFSGYCVYLGQQYNAKHLPWYSYFYNTSDYSKYRALNNATFGHWSSLNH